MTSRLIAQLPSEYCRTFLVPIHYEADIVLIRLLCPSIRIERGGVAPEIRAVCIDTTQIIPVVQHRQDQFNTILLRSSHSRVKTTDSVSAVVDADLMRYIV